MPTLLIRGPDGTLVERELVGRLTVGCDDDNDLVLREAGVERRHASFFADGGEVVLEQLDFSAAQTLVDGERATAPVRLRPGVRVLIGGYEVQVKPGSQQLTVKKLDTAASTLTDDGPAASFPWVAVLVIAGLAFAGLAGAAVFKRLTAPAPAVVKEAAVKEPCSDLEPDLRIAREGATQRSLDAVERVLDCEPLHEEANQLERAIVPQLKGDALRVRAGEFAELGQDEQALDVLEQIPKGTEAERLALPLLREVALRLQKRCAADCKAYAGKPQAKARCDEAARLASLGAEPKAAPLEGPGLEQKVAARLREPLLEGAVLLYAKGRSSEAMVKLQALRERADKAALHAQADQLRKNIATAEGLYKIGHNALEKHDLVRAVAAFKEARALDEQLLPEGGSVLATTIAQEAASAAYAEGAVHARHQDWVKACAAWKLGFDMYRGNSDLVAALTRDCTERARQLSTSSRCADLATALELAVRGDDLEGPLTKRAEELGCAR